MTAALITLREARLVVPGFNNSGIHDPAIIAEVRRRLVMFFDSYTETTAVGAYVMPSGETKAETVHLFDIAAGYDSLHTLRSIAKFVAHEMDQEAVYLRHTSGVVEFVRRQEADAAA